MQFTQNAIKPGFYRINGEMREFTRDHIAAYCEGTRKALKAGLSIPILDAHDFSGDPSCGPTTNKNGTSGLGWITGVIHHNDGSMSQKLDVTDPEAARKIKNGSIRHTSPQFLEDFTDGDGVHYGPIVRHVALTPTPRTKHQGPIVPDNEPLTAISFSEDDYLGSTLQEAETAMASFAENGPEKKPVETPTEPPVENAPEPEMVEPVKDAMTEEAKVEALVSELQQLSGMTVADSTSTVEVLTAVVNMLKARAIQEAKEKEELAPQPQEEAPPLSFSEEQLAVVDGLTAKVARLEKVNAAKAAFVARGGLVASLNSSGLPPKLTSDLVQMAEAVSFGEDGAEEPTLTLSQVAALVKRCLPQNLTSFSEANVKEEQHPDGAEFTGGDDETADEKHKEIADHLLRK